MRSWALFLNQIKDLAGAYMPEKGAYSGKGEQNKVKDIKSVFILMEV